MFLGRDQHGLAFLNWVRHFLAISIKVHEFLQNSVFSPKSARFVNSALGASLYSDYQQSARVCTKQSFKPDSARFLIAALGTPLLSDFQQSARVWRRSARFVILAPGTPLFSHFQQSARVCGKQRFQPETRTFRHFRTACTTF